MTRVNAIRVEYDPTIDAGYIYFQDISPGEVARTIKVDADSYGPGELFIDFDASGHVLGIEVLGSAIMPDGFFQKESP